MAKPVGWRNQPARHSLASRGVKTGSHRGLVTGGGTRTSVYDFLWKHASAAYNREPDKGKWRKYIWWFDGVPPAFGRKLITEHPNIIAPGSNHNDSPTAKEIVELTERYNGEINGYAIPPESGRDDSRVTFDGFVIRTDEATARKLQDQLKPDEFSPQNGGWRFWWD